MAARSKILHTNRCLLSLARARAGTLFLAVAVAAACPVTASAVAEYLVSRSDQGVLFRGPSPGVSFSWSPDDRSHLAAADFDGDGRDDLLVPGFARRPSDSAIVGAAALRYGHAPWPAVDDVNLTPADTTFFGTGVTEALATGAVGDLNGDGRPDLILVEKYADGPGGLPSGAGQVHVFFGGVRLPATLDLAVAVPDVHFFGSAGFDIDGVKVGDLDGDGRDDLVLLSPDVAPRDAAVFRGRASWPAVLDLQVDAPDVWIQGLGRFDATVDIADITGDSRGEIVVLDYSVPEVKVFAGRATWPSLFDVSAMAADAAFPLRSNSVASLLVVDVVGDATKDLVLNDPPPPGSPLGRAHVLIHAGGPALLGSPPADCTILAPADRQRLQAQAAADLDGDGSGDLVLGSADANGWRLVTSDAGRISVVRGPLSGMVDLATRAADLVIHGGVGHELEFTAVGDLDGNGMPDLALEQASNAYIFLQPGFGPTPAAADMFVDAARGSDSLDGLSWAAARRTVGSALSSIVDLPGSVIIHVAEGTYAERLTVGGNTALEGSYVTGQGTRDAGLAASVLDGGGSGIVVTVQGAGGLAPARIDGFTIRGGYWSSGAGVTVYRSPGNNQGASGLLLANSVVTGNTVEARNRLEECFYTDFNGFPAVYFYCDRGLSGVGSGIVAFEPATLVNVLVAENDLVVPQCFGDFGSPPVECFLPPDEPLWAAGGGIAALAPVTLMNCTVAANTLGGLVTESPGLLTVADSVLFGNGGSDIRIFNAGIPSGIQTNIVGVTTATLPAGNSGADPMFVDAAAGDFRLSQIAAGQGADSPALDAGSVDASSACLPPAFTTCLDALSTRTDGEPDLGRVDLGHHGVANRAPRFAGLSGLTAEPGCALRLEWSPATDPDGDAVTFYRIYRAESAGGQDFGLPLAVLAAPASDYVDGTPVFGTTYHYVVRSLDATGREDRNLIEASAAPVDEGIARLTSFTAAGSGGCQASVDLGLLAPCSGISRVELHRSPTPGFTPDATTLVATDPAFPFADSVPTDGIYYYRAIANATAGGVLVTPQVDARVDSCGGAPPPPAEARITDVRKTATAIEVEIVPTPGADFNRLYRGSLPIRSGVYDHGAEVGIDRLPGTPDDRGSCRFDVLVGTDPTGRTPSNFYYLVVGVNVAGEGIHSTDSFGRNAADGTFGPLDCP